MLCLDDYSSQRGLETIQGLKKNYHFVLFWKSQNLSPTSTNKYLIYGEKDKVPVEFFTLCLDDISSQSDLETISGPKKILSFSSFFLSQNHPY